MAASAWVVYNRAKKAICNGDTVLDDFGITRYKMALLKDTYVPSAAHETWNDVSAHQINTGFGYDDQGQAFITHDVIANATGCAWDIVDLSFAASGGTIADIKFAVVHDIVSNMLICYSQLETTKFSITAGNDLLVQIDVNGVFKII